MRNDDAFGQYTNYWSVHKNDENSQVDLPRQSTRTFSSFPPSRGLEPKFSVITHTEPCRALFR